MVSDVNFIGALALYQHRRDNAVGLHHLTQAQKGLLWYYNLKQQELARKILKVILAKASINLIDRRMAAIMTEAQTASIERQRELLTEAIKLKKQAQGIIKRGK